MEEGLKRAFQAAKYEPNKGLAPEIWRAVAMRNKRILFLKIASFSSLGIAALIGFIPMFQMLINDFAKSGFYEYLSLAFSSGGSITSYWKELVFSLAESLPTTSIVIVLVIVFIFFLSLRYVMKQIINNKSIGQSYGIA